MEGNDSTSKSVPSHGCCVRNTILSLTLAKPSIQQGCIQNWNTLPSRIPLQTSQGTFEDPKSIDGFMVIEMLCGRLHSRHVSTTPILTRRGKCVYQSSAQKTGNQPPRQTKVRISLVAILTLCYVHLAMHQNVMGISLHFVPSAEGYHLHTKGCCIHIATVTPKEGSWLFVYADWAREFILPACCLDVPHWM